MDYPGPSDSILVQPLVVELVGESESSQLEAELRYDPTDPYAATVTFGSGEGQVQWTLSRDLIALGLCEPTGEGDVHVRPTIDAAGRAAVLIGLSSPDGQALVQARSRDLRRFVDAMAATVVPGTESQYVDVDATIASILMAGADE